MDVDGSHERHEYNVHFLPFQIKFFLSLNAINFGFPDDVPSEIG